MILLLRLRNQAKRIDMESIHTEFDTINIFWSLRLKFEIEIYSKRHRNISTFPYELQSPQLFPNQQQIIIVEPQFSNSQYPHPTTMWKYIKLLYKRVPDPIRNITPISLPSSLNQAFGSKIYYTPKLQKLAFTEELAKYLRFINRKDKITDADLHSLTEAILVEYGNIHGLQSHPKFKDQINYGITKKYLFKQNELSPFYGEVDYMIWLNRTHFVPVLFLEKELNEVAGLALAHATMALKSLARNTTITSGYSIVTTGQQWQMFKVYNNLRAEKTVVYEGRNRFRNIVEDYDMIQVIFGLIDQSLQTEREQVNILKLAYDVIDEKRFMLEANTKEEAQKISPVSKVLLNLENKIKQLTSK